MLWPWPWSVHLHRLGIFSLVQFSSLPRPQPKAEPTRDCFLSHPQGSAPGPSLAINSLSSTQVLSWYLPPPLPLKLNSLVATFLPAVCSVVNNSEGLSWNEWKCRGYLLWSPSTVYAPFPWLAIGCPGYGQGGNGLAGSWAGFPRRLCIRASWSRGRVP